MHDLLQLDLCTITPLQALTLLHDLQQQARALRHGQWRGSMSPSVQRLDAVTLQAALLPGGD